MRLCPWLGKARAAADIMKLSKGVALPPPPRLSLLAQDPRDSLLALAPYLKVSRRQSDRTSPGPGPQEYPQRL